MWQIHWAVIVTDTVSDTIAFFIVVITIIAIIFIKIITYKTIIINIIPDLALN